MVFNLTQSTKEPYMPPSQIRIKKLSSHGMFADQISISKFSVCSRYCHLVIPFVLSSFLSIHFITPVRISSHFRESAVVFFCAVPTLTWIWLYSTHHISKYVWVILYLNGMQARKFTEMFKLVYEVALILIPALQYIWLPRESWERRKTKET